MHRQPLLKNNPFEELQISLFYFFVIIFKGAYSQSTSKIKVKYNYLLYLPKKYSNQTKKYPLVIYLHGDSQRGSDLNKLTTYGLPYLIDKGKDFDFIIASPQCPENKYWPAENWLDSLWLELMAKYRIDTNRLYLTATSMGGYGAWIVAMDYPDKFAAIVPLCGGCNDEDTGRICKISHIPVWAFHGTADDKVAICETERIVNKLKACNGNIKFTRLENKVHGIENLYERQPAIYKWMLKQQRKN